MGGGLADQGHIAVTFARAGVLRPSRPDRVARALSSIARWGPTLPAGYEGAAARFPSATAIIDERGTITFAEIQRRTNALANAWAARGIVEGDRVAILCRNHRGFIEASVACAKLGAHPLYL